MYKTGTRRVTSRRAGRELGVTFRLFAESARAVVDWYRAHAPGAVR